MSAGRTGLLLGVSILWLPLAFLFDGVTTLVLPLRAGGDPATLGLVSFAGLAVGGLLQPIAGWASDRLRPRLDRRRFVALAAAPAILGTWLLAGIGPAGAAGLAAVVAGYVLVQAAAAALQAGAQALIPEHVDDRRHGRASGLRLAFDVGGAFTAFLVLGSLLSGPGMAAAGVAIGAVLLAGVVLVLLLVPPSVAPDARAVAPGPGPRARPGPGSWALPPGLGRLIVGRFLFLLGTYAVGRFLVLLVAERLGVDPGQAMGEAGGLLALLSLATAVAAIPLGRLADRTPGSRVMVAGALAGGAGIAILALPAGLSGLAAGGLLLSLGTAAFVTANWAAATSLVPAADAGRLLGLVSLATAFAAACAGLLGVVVASAGFVPALLLAALVTGAAALSHADVGAWFRPAREVAR